MYDKPEAVTVYLSDPRRDELAAAVLVAQLLEPSVEVADIRRQLADLCDRLVVAAPQGVSVEALVGFLRDDGFQAAADSQSLDCSRIDLVLARKRGIPITLSIPYLLLGRGVGMNTQGINFPGHFLVAANDALIDPLHAQVLTRSEGLQRLADANLQHLGSAAFAPASPDDMAVRMLNNVKAIYVSRGDFVAALEVVDWQLPLVEHHGAFELERAEFWYRLGNAAAAIGVLEAARARTRGTPLQAEIDSRLKRLARLARTTVH
jgi:regulator of sirC expression with transglutaminase-like and TPR domain